MSRIGLFMSLILTITVLACAAAAATDYEDLTRCPPGMADIDGEYCVDTYEFPNKKGEYSTHGVTWERADFLCTQAGKRLCSRSEWQKACSGPEKLTYPYGNDYEKGICSDPYTAEGRGHYKSGDLEMCANGYGLFDMSGNLAEWTADTYDGGASANIQGGDAFTEESYDLSCRASYKRSADSEDAYNGLRCCADVITEPVKRSDLKGIAVRGAASSQVHNPLSRHKKTFTQSVEYVNVDDLLGSGPLDSYVAAAGVNLTTSYQFAGGRVDYTRMEYRVDSVNLGTTDDTNVGLNVIHGNLLIPLAINFWDWDGDVHIGARRMDSGVGSLTEVYFTKEYIEGFWTVIPSVSHLQSSVSGSETGVGFDVRYHVNPHVDLLARYNTEDYYKTLLNDFIVPYTNNAYMLKCEGCREDSTALGMDYALAGGRSKVYLMWYDIGDMDIPIGGASIDF